jgi:cyclopropane fatty-acyl-phospholipid synthase-like methyltransferase
METTNFTHFRNLFDKYITKDINNMLVLGCGELRYEMYLNAKHILAVDWADSQLEKAKEKAITLKYDIIEICNIIPNKSFDVVVMFDVLEHITKDKALILLSELNNKITKQIILFTPIQKDLGYTQEEVNKLQNERKTNNLPMGYHLSLWTPQDFEQLGFIGEYSENYHAEKNLGAVFCVKNL